MLFIIIDVVVTDVDSAVVAGFVLLLLVVNVVATSVDSAVAAGIVLLLIIVNVVVAGADTNRIHKAATPPDPRGERVSPLGPPLFAGIINKG